ncbi:MAG: hypothetical protein ACI8XO_004129 [Verrucomicrobiales bacterium]|jgi:hypothetical protein
MSAAETGCGSRSARVADGILHLPGKKHVFSPGGDCAASVGVLRADQIRSPARLSLDAGCAFCGELLAQRLWQNGERDLAVVALCESLLDIEI